MRGRPPKQGVERYPCGDIRPSAAPLQRRASELERLQARGVLKGRHLAAAREWARLAARHDVVVLNRSRAPKSPRYELGRAPGGGHVAGAVGCCDPHTKPCQRCRKANAVKREWSEAKAALGPAWGITYNVVLLDLACPDGSEQSLAAGLDSLARLFGTAGTGTQNARNVTQRTESIVWTEFP
jgi:hypothetical protein